MKKLLLLMSFCLTLTLGQAQVSHANGPRAALAYNAGKNDAGTINFDTSFFIFDHNLNEQEKREKEKEILKADPSFKKLVLLDANGTRDMMVIVHIEASGLTSLTEKIRTLLQTLGVYNVEYNGDLVPLDKFNF